jgi:hypothetical protein
MILILSIFNFKHDIPRSTSKCRHTYKLLLRLTMFFWEKKEDHQIRNIYHVTIRSIYLTYYRKIDYGPINLF